MPCMKCIHQAILVAVFAATLHGQTAARLEVTSPLGRSFQSQPDDKAVVSAAEQALAADPQNVKLLLKPSRAQASVWRVKEAVLNSPRGLAIDPNNARTRRRARRRGLSLR